MTTPPQRATDRRIDRRHLLELSMFGSIAAAASAVGLAAQSSDTPPRTHPPAPAPAMPTVDARFPAEVAPGVFVVPDKRIPLVPNIGIVVGRDSVLVVDCGLGLESAEHVLTLARQLAPGRRIVLTVTHAHPEHGFGAQVFRKDARTYYNRAQRDYLTRAGATLLEGFRTGVLPAGQQHLLDGIVLAGPDEIYDGNRATLDLGGRRVEFRTWGTAHSPGDQIVYMPDERTVFAGDLLEERMFPIVPLFPPMITAEDIDISQWELALTDIRGLDPRLIVPGHGNLGGVEVIGDVLEYFEDVRRTIHAADMPDSALEERIRARYPTWEHSQYIAPAVQYFSGQERGAR